MVFFRTRLLLEALGKKQEYRLRPLSALLSYYYVGGGGWIEGSQRGEGWRLFPACWASLLLFSYAKQQLASLFSL
jgi:hypothetical protein